eukprot:1445534-Ditylum_brightwellii.AAC.1
MPQIICASATVGRTLRRQLMTILSTPSLDKTASLITSAQDVRTKKDEMKQQGDAGDGAGDDDSKEETNVVVEEENVARVTMMKLNKQQRKEEEAKQLLIDTVSKVKHLMSSSSQTTQKKKKKKNNGPKLNLLPTFLLPPLPLLLLHPTTKQQHKFMSLEINLQED